MQVGRLVGRVNCLLEPFSGSLICVLHTVQNGSLREARQFQQVTVTDDGRNRLSRNHQAMPGKRFPPATDWGRSEVAPRPYSVASLPLGASARHTYKYFSSLDVTTDIFLSRVTRFKAERRFCIFSPFSPLSGTLTACWAFSFERSARMSATALRCFPLRPCGTSDRFTDA